MKRGNLRLVASRDSRLGPQLVETNGARKGRVHDVSFGDHIIGRGARCRSASTTRMYRGATRGWSSDPMG